MAIPELASLSSIEFASKPISNNEYSDLLQQFQKSKITKTTVDFIMDLQQDTGVTVT